MDWTAEKTLGNDAYRRGDFEAAINHYTQAIAVCPTESTLFSNRAMCYKKLRDFEQCRTDAQKAVEIEEVNIKGQMLLGSSLCDLGRSDASTERIQAGIDCLSRALGLCASQSLRHYEAELKLRLLLGICV